MGRPDSRLLGQMLLWILADTIYAALLGATGAVLVAERKAAFAVAATMLGLLLLGIRNAWDMATTLAHSGMIWLEGGI